MVRNVADVVAFTGIAAVVGIVVVVSFVANIFVTVAFGVVVLIEVRVVTVGADADAVAVVALRATVNDILEGVVILVL